MNLHPVTASSVFRNSCFAILTGVVLLLVYAKPVEAAPAPQSYTQAMFELAHPAGLHKFAKAVSSPDSRRYQQYKPVEWIVKRFGAKPKTKRRALRWLEARGIEASVDGSGQSLIATLGPNQTELFLNAGASASSARDGGEGRIPASLRGVVTGVAFLDTDPDKFETQGAFPPQPSGSSYPPGSSARPHSGTQAGCAAGKRGATIVPEENRNFTPNQWMDAYGISDLHKQGFRGQGRRIAVIEIDGFKRSDVVAYGKCFGSRVPPTKVYPTLVKKPLAPGAETTLDLEILTSVTPGLAGIDVYQGPGSEGGIMVMVGRALGAPGTRPSAISISLGQCEPTLYGEMQFRRGLNNIFAVAAGAGISVVVAAGDNGSAECSTNGNAVTLPLLSVSDPSSSPWVTAVGGTNLELDSDNRILREFVWNDGPGFGPNGGGGGRSILATTRPWYQQGTKKFRNLGLTRAVPDVALLADNRPGYGIYCTAPGNGGCTGPALPAGGWQPVGGTSAATPLTAAMLTLISQKLEKSGKRRVGFANPLLYKLGKSKKASSVFRDVVAGNNDVGPAIPAAAGGGKKLGCCYTTKGYDLASGWGSIKAIGLYRAAAGLAKKK